MLYARLESRVSLFCSHIIRMTATTKWKILFLLSKTKKAYIEHGYGSWQYPVVVSEYGGCGWVKVGLLNWRKRILHGESHFCILHLFHFRLGSSRNKLARASLLKFRIRKKSHLNFRTFCEYVLAKNSNFSNKIILPKIIVNFFMDPWKKIVKNLEFFNFNYPHVYMFVINSLLGPFDFF